MRADARIRRNNGAKYSKNGNILINKGDHEALLVLRTLSGDWPHVVDNDVLFHGVEREAHRGIEQCKLRVKCQV